MKKLIIAEKEFNSRLFLGTGKFNSNTVMEEAILASGCEMVTVAMKRIELDDKEDDMLKQMQPHAMAFTWILLGASSLARPLVKEFIPPLQAE